MLTQLLFTAIVVAVIIQRLFELRISKRHVTALLAQGGQVQSENLLGWVKILQVSWWVAMLVEVWAFNRPFIPGLAAFVFLMVVVGQILRYISMQALGQRWTLPIVTVQEPAIATGPYRYLRHPNWLGVILEIAGLPLIHSAYWTALGFAIANALILHQRIQTEEKALSDSSNYRQMFANTPRLIPKLRVNVQRQSQGRKWT